MVEIQAQHTQCLQRSATLFKKRLLRIQLLLRQHLSPDIQYKSNAVCRSRFLLFFRSRGRLSPPDFCIPHRCSVLFCRSFRLRRSLLRYSLHRFCSRDTMGFILLKRMADTLRSHGCQRPEINLAAGCQRHILNRKYPGWHHIYRKYFANSLHQAALAVFHPAVRLIEGTQFHGSVFLADSHSSRLLCTAGFQDRTGNFIQLHPLAVQLDLGIPAPEEIIRPVQAQPSHIPAFIHSLSRNKRVRQKSLLRQIRSGNIASGQTFTGHI